VALISEEMLDRIQDDGETVTAEGASQAEIMSVQQAVGVRFPPGYIQFLRRFNGGEFRHVRMHCVSDLAVTSDQARAYVPAIADGQMFPFGSSWGGDLYCFKLSEPAGDGEYPILLWNHEYSEEPDDEPYLWEPQANDFAAFLTAVYTD